MVSPDNRFVYVGFDDDWEDYSISMIGSGSNLANFETNWVNTTAFSIGTTNFGQTLIPWPTNGSPVDPDAYTGTVTIVSAALSNASDRVYFTAYAEEAGLMPSVWYVTNLLNVTSNDWQLRTEDFGHSAAGTNYQIWCQQVTPPVFYRIGMSMP